MKKRNAYFWKSVCFSLKKKKSEFGLTFEERVVIILVRLGDVLITFFIAMTKYPMEET